MSGRPVLQKLLSLDMGGAIFGRGADQVGGLVVEAADIAGLGRPAETFQAYEFGEDPPFVDVVRFRVPVCATIAAAGDRTGRPWPTYPSGFLRPVAGCVVPIWQMSRSRWPAGAEYWRVQRDGSQEPLSVYPGSGAGLGWRPRVASTEPAGGATGALARRRLPRRRHRRTRQTDHPR